MDFLKFLISDLCAHPRIQTNDVTARHTLAFIYNGLSVYKQKKCKSSNSHLPLTSHIYIRNSIEGNEMSFFSQIASIECLRVCVNVMILFVAHLCLCMWKGRGFEIESGKQIQKKASAHTTDRMNYRYKDKQKWENDISLK